MISKTLTGLEAILLMQEGGYVTDGQHIYRFVNTKIEASDITSFNKGKPEWKSGNVFNFNYDQYKEYTKPKPLTGWERVGENESYYSINGNCYVEEMTEDMCMEDKYYYEDANYFSTESKAEEIDFKQTLFRKLQRFSDENRGNEIDWSDCSKKFCINYDYYNKKLDIFDHVFVKQFGQVYFISEEIAQKAIELFHGDLIKYFTQDWRG